MKYEGRVVSLMICSLAGTSLAFSPALPLSRWNHGRVNSWSHEKRSVQEYQQHTTRTPQDRFRLMNSYLDSLGSAAVDDSPPGTTTAEATPFQTQGVKSFHPQGQQQHSETKVIETTATVVSPTETQTSASVQNQNVQSQYFPQPQQPMESPTMTQQPPQQQQQAQPPQVQPPNPNFGAPPPQGFQQQPVDTQQSIPPNHETGYFNQPQPTSSISESQVPPIPPNVPIPQPPELQPPPTPQNFDPHGPNFGTGTPQVHGQPPPMQQPPMQQPPMQSYSQGATSYSPYQQQQPMQQPSGSQANQVYQPPQTTASYPNGGNVAPQTQQQQQQQQPQQAPFGQAQQQTQVYNPSMGSFPQQDLPMQGPPPSNLNGQPVQPQSQQQQQQYGSFPQQNHNVAASPLAGYPSYGNPTAQQAPLTTQQPMAQQQQPPQAQVPPPRPQFDPHELMSEQRPNTGGGNWYDTHMRKPNRKFDTVHPWERDNNPQPLPPRNQQPLVPTQQSFDPHSPSWDSPMPGTPAAAASVPRGVAVGTTNLQGTSWHKDPNSWQGSQGLPYQDHPMNPLAAGMPPVAAIAPPPIQPMTPPKRQPFDPHNPDWTRPLSSEIQGESRNTWQNHIGVPRVMVDLFSDGRPIDSEIELWQGPSNEPHKIKMYSEDGGIRPFKAVVETPGYGSSIDIKNSGPTAFPIQANVQPMPFRYEPERFKQVQGENSLYTVSLNDYATSALVTLETDGMPLMALVELWQGPDNTPQKVKVYNEQGLPFQLMVETPGPQCTVAVRNIGPMEFPLYCAVSARVD